MNFLFRCGIYRVDRLKKKNSRGTGRREKKIFSSFLLTSISIFLSEVLWAASIFISSAASSTLRLLLGSNLVVENKFSSYQENNTDIYIYILSFIRVFNLFIYPNEWYLFAWNYSKNWIRLLTLDTIFYYWNRESNNPNLSLYFYLSME